MIEGKSGRMQGRPLQNLFKQDTKSFDTLVRLWAAQYLRTFVDCVCNQGMPHMARMHTHLVRPASLQLKTNQGSVTRIHGLDDFVMRDSRFTPPVRHNSHPQPISGITCNCTSNRSLGPC